jgi:MinD superfamily P-loop ATPase
VINKFQKEATLITNYCDTEDIPVLMELPFDRRLAEAYSKGQLAVEIYPELGKRFRELAIKIEKEFINNGHEIGYLKNTIKIKTTEISEK